MMVKENPYAIGFGMIPTQYISRDLIIDTSVRGMILMRLPRFKEFVDEMMEYE